MLAVRYFEIGKDLSFIWVFILPSHIAVVNKHLFLKDQCNQQLCLAGPHMCFLGPPIWTAGISIYEYENWK